MQLNFKFSHLHLCNACIPAFKSIYSLQFDGVLGFWGPKNPKTQQIKG